MEGTSSGACVVAASRWRSTAIDDGGECRIIVAGERVVMALIGSEKKVDTRHMDTDGVSAAPRISVVIPTLNEARNLPHVFARLPEDLHEIILVDGHSTDDTVAVARALYPACGSSARRAGARATRCAAASTPASGDIIVMLDADGSTDRRGDPALRRRSASAAPTSPRAHASRRGGGSADITRLRRLGNWGLNALVNVLYGTRYSDLCYGYNAFWAHCLPTMDVDCDGFEVETLINVRVAKAGLRIVEVPSYEGARIHGVSNLNAWRDGWRVLRTILSERFVGDETADPDSACPEVDTEGATA